MRSAASDQLARLFDLADARANLADFCGLVDIPGVPIERDEDADDLDPARPEPAPSPPERSGIRRPQAAHHRLLIERLSALERGDIRRLMVFMPPGSAKSTYASVVFPAWFLGRGERRSVILATYASELARKIGRRMRSVVRQPIYGAIFSAALMADQRAADEWALDNGNEFMGGGILAGLTGNRADLLIIDDPIKGRSEADSPQIRARTRAEYDDSLLTRLKPGGRIVLIQTRWHEDDLAGSILPEDYDGQSGPILCRDGQVWEVLCIPAQAERMDDPLGRSPGQMLWPEWFDAAHWAPYRSNPRTWSALYQQRPGPDEGVYFQRAAFRRFSQDDLPRSLRYFGSSDYAVTQGGGDWTRHRIWAVDAASPSNLYLIDGWGGQTSCDLWIEAKLDLMERYRGRGLYKWFGEAGVIQRSIEPMLRRRMRERDVYCPIEWMPSVGDKASRARSAQALTQQGRVFIRDDADGDLFIDECAAFPFGRHDDDVDCFSLIGRVIDQLHPPKPRYRPQFAETEDDD